jgi:hypothetical protein
MGAPSSTDSGCCSPLVACGYRSMRSPPSTALPFAPRIVSRAADAVTVAKPKPRSAPKSPSRRKGVGGQATGGCDLLRRLAFGVGPQAQLAPGPATLPPVSHQRRRGAAAGGCGLRAVGWLGSATRHTRCAPLWYSGWWAQLRDQRGQGAKSWPPFAPWVQ